MMHMEPVQRMHLRYRLRELLMDKDFEASELFSGIAALGWGLLVAWPFIDTFSTSPTFTAMAQIAPEWAWGWGGICTGAMQLAALILGTHRLRYLATWLVLVGWLFMACTFVRSNPWSTASVIYPTLALSDAWAVWRLTILRRVE